VKKGDGVGKLVFLDRQTLTTSAELDVAPESASHVMSAYSLMCSLLSRLCCQTFVTCQTFLASSFNPLMPTVAIRVQL